MILTRKLKKKLGSTLILESLIKHNKIMILGNRLAIFLKRVVKYSICFLVFPGSLVAENDYYMEVLLRKAIHAVHGSIEVEMSDVYITKGEAVGKFCDHTDASGSQHSYVVFFTPSISKDGSVTLGGDACIYFDEDYEIDRVVLGE